MLSETKTNAAGAVSQSGDIGASRSPTYTNTFFEERQAQTWEAALRIVPYVLEVIQPGKRG